MDERAFQSLIVQRDIETIAGYISGEFPCYYENNVSGKLYAGSLAVHFVGNFLLFEKRVTITWEDIRRVQKMEQGVEIVQKDGKCVHFTNLHQPERVWVLLVSLHNDTLLDRPGKRQTITPRSVKRRNSDPTLVSMVADQFFAEEEEQDPEKETESTRVLGRIASTRQVEQSVMPEKRGSEIGEVERNVGKLRLQPIHCTYNNTKGKLYVGVEAIFFYGKRFFWDKRIVLVHFHTVRQIQVNDNDHGLSVVTKEGQVHLFTEMESPDKVWASLIAIHNEILTEKAIMKRRSYRRMNSDPLAATTAFDQEDSDDDFFQSAPTSQSLSIGVPESTNESVKNELGVTSTPAQDWESFKAGATFTNRIVDHYELPCTLERFHEVFISDDAPYSIGKFLQDRGDTNLHVSKWTVNESLQTRVVQYMHPVNAPLAPPQASARKEQTFRRFGDAGLSIETKTVVDDVPMADCFYVADRILVESSGENVVSLTMEYDITFVKSTMFKGIISKTTKSEFSVFFEDMGNYMSRALGETKKLVPAPPVVPPTAESTLISPIAYVAMVLVAMVFGLQLWILVEVRGIKRMLAALPELSANTAPVCDAI